MYSLGLLLVFLTVLRNVATQDCTPSSIVNCLRAFDGSQVMNLSSPMDADLPRWNESLNELKDRCLRFRRYSGCIQTVIPNCNQSVHDYLIGLDDAYTLLCGTDAVPNTEGLTEFLDYEKCYGSERVITEEKFCNESYLYKLNSLDTIDSQQDRVLQFCKYTDSYLQCLTDTISGNCDKFAAAWQTLWNRRKRQQYLWNTLRCPNWNDESNNTAIIWTVVLSVVLGVTTLLMIIGILVILLFINRKKKTRRRATIPPPPPYTSDPCMVYEGSSSPNPQEESTEPTVSLPAHPSSFPSSSGEVNGAVGITMQPSAKYLVKPPPYMGLEAPAYEAEEECSGGTEQGKTNSGFEEEDVSEKEEGERGVSEGARTNASPVATATTVTDSERELNTDWF